MIIDRDRLFYGDRIGSCSNSAHLHFAFYLLASDGFARLELNYIRIAGTAFCRFSPPPSEADFRCHMTEYANARLLFPYSVGGKLWVQWDVPPNLLPRFKAAADHRSPPPPEPDFARWLKWVRSGVPVNKPMKAEDFLNVSATFGRNCGVGLGLGEGLGEAKDCSALSSPAAVPLGQVCAHCKSGNGRVPTQLGENKSPTPERVPGPLRVDTDGRTWEDRFDQWWTIYPRKVGKQEAKRAYKKQIGDSPERHQELLANTQHWCRLEWQPMLERGEGQYIPYPATYLNKARWEEPPENHGWRPGKATPTEAELIRQLEEPEPLS